MLLDLRNSRLVASSGIRRLQMYQLQEQALVKDAIQKAVAEVLNTQEEVKQDEQVQGQEAPSRKVKATPRRKPVVEVAEEHFPEVRFKRKPIYIDPTPVNENLPLWLVQTTIQTNYWVRFLIPLWKKQTQVIIETKRAAANDADIRLRILLLAA